MIAGKYELLEPIGAGGMASVHRARERGLGGFERVVAVKLMSRPLDAHPAFVARFIHEARIACGFAHPNVIQIYDFGDSEKGLYIAMERVEGCSLLDIVRRAIADGMSIPLEVVLSILHDLCDALDHVHTRVGLDGQPLDIVHRDVSLSNVLVTTGGHLKLIDFGVATSRGCEAPTQALVGKPSYIAPEVLRTGTGDARVDVYACGVIGWELLAGKRLFVGATDIDTFRRVLEDDVCEPSRLRADVSVEIDAILASALARDPARRFASAAAMRGAIDAATRMLRIELGPAVVAQWLAHLEMPSIAPEAETITLPKAAIQLAATPPRSIALSVPTNLFVRMRVRSIALTAAAVIVCGLPFTMQARWSEAAAPSAEPAASIVVSDRIAPPAVAPPPQPAAVSATPPSPRPLAVTIKRRESSHAVVVRIEPAPPRTVSSADHVATIAPMPTPSAPLAELVVPAPAFTDTPPLIRPDQVTQLSGSIARLDLEAASVHVAALICIDDRGVVTSAKLVGSAPPWARDRIVSDLRAFRFSPYRVGATPRAACFSRQLAIVH